jgi:hypothetical protein
VTRGAWRVTRLLSAVVNGFTNCSELQTFGRNSEI